MINMYCIQVYKQETTKDGMDWMSGSQGLQTQH